VIGVQQTPTVSGRLNLLHAPNGVRVIDDTYNANLASMTAALDYLATFSGKKIAVLGHMGELGSDAEAMHQQLGQRARQRGVDQLLCIGDLSRATAIGFGQGAQHFNDIDALIATLTTLLENNTSVLVKGSRSARMERVVQALVPDNKNKEGAH
jgi:UDP-N-acetylmuramoyl-tripeptide--D-alanyl-D-alanine ligase